MELARERWTDTGPIFTKFSLVREREIIRRWCEDFITELHQDSGRTDSPMSLSAGVQGRHHKQVTFNLDFEGQEGFIKDRRRRAFWVVEETHDALHEEGPLLQSLQRIS